MQKEIQYYVFGKMYRSLGTNTIRSFQMVGVLVSEDKQQDPEELIREKLGSKREILEALAELDNSLSEDAKEALRMLEEDDQD